MKKNLCLLLSRSLLSALLIVFTYAACLPSEDDKASSGNGMQGGDSSGLETGDADLQGGSHAGNPYDLQGGSHAGNPSGLKLREIKGKLLLDDKGGCQADQLVFQCPYAKSVVVDVAKDGSFSTYLVIDHACAVDLLYKEKSVASVVFQNGPQAASSSFMYVGEGETVIDLQTLTCIKNEKLGSVEVYAENNPAKQSDQDKDAVNDFEDGDDNGNGTPDEDEFPGRYFNVYEASVSGASCPDQNSVWKIELVKDSPMYVIISILFHETLGWETSWPKIFLKGIQESEGEYTVAGEAQAPWPKQETECRVYVEKDEKDQYFLNLECPPAKEVQEVSETCYFNDFPRLYQHPLVSSIKAGPAEIAHELGKAAPPKKKTTPPPTTPDKFDKKGLDKKN